VVGNSATWKPAAAPLLSDRPGDHRGIVASDLPALKSAIETFWRDLGYGDLPKLE